MGRFSERNRERLRSEMIAEGRELFAQFGFERTRIRDVTDAVDIGTSTFYQFFDSKEALYAEVLVTERDVLEQRLEEAMADADSDRAEVSALLRTMFEQTRTNPLISRLIIEDELRTAQAQLSKGERESIAMNSRDGTVAHVEKWINNPDFRYDDPDLVQGLVRSLVFTTRMEGLTPDMELDVEYDAIEQTLVETIVNGLFGSSEATTTARQ